MMQNVFTLSPIPSPIKGEGSFQRAKGASV